MMSSINFVYLCILLFARSITPKRNCGPNEMEVDCPAVCASDYCPTSSVQAEPCPKPNPCPAPACKCLPDYRRAENNTCILTKNCPPFQCSGLNEVYTSCPPLCTDDCSGATTTGQCPPTFGFILVVLPCTPKCRCRKYYWRKNGTCVPYSLCNI